MKEDGVYIQVAQYLNLRYPNTPYHFDLSGVWTPSHKARNLYGKLNRRAWPDLFIARTSFSSDSAIRRSYGLFLEIKKAGTKVYKKDGTIVTNTHIQEQARILEMLREEGYDAEFAVGFDECKELIDNYLGGIDD